MRPHAVLAAIAVLAAGMLAPATGEAQSGPTPDQTPEPRNRRVQVVNIGS